MNEFLDRVFLDNTVRSYFIVAGVILFVLVVKRFVSRYIAWLIFRVIKKFWKDIDRLSFSNLLVQPLGFFLLVLVTIVALHKLNFPSQLDVDIYRFTTRQLLHALGSVILVITFIWLLLRTIDFIAVILERKANLTPQQADNQLIVFFKDFFKVLVAVIGFLMVLKFGFDFRISNLVTGISIATAAIALATRESLENLIASFIIFFDKPFTLGDVVKVQNVTGTVEKIGLRSTRIRTDQKTFVTVPNKQMVDSILDNLSLRTQRKAEIRLEISLATPAPKLEALVNGIEKISDDFIEEKTVFLEDIKNNSFLIHYDFYTAPIAMSEFNALKQRIQLQVLKLIESSGIELAGSGHDIRIKGNAREQELRQS